MRLLLSVSVNLCRLLLAAVFVFSGYVKAIDPLGTQYKIQDYLAALSLPGLLPDWFTLLLSVGLSAVEFVLGIAILFAIRRRLASRLMLVFMVGMTVLSVWLAVANPVEDCGCFGDAVKLSNTETLAKNIVLLACSGLLVYRPLLMPRLIAKNNQWIVSNYSLVFILVSSMVSLYTLPPFDFRPYHVGADIRKGMEIPEDAQQPEFETTFVLSKDGRQETFTLDNYPDSTWEFVDSHTRMVKKGYVPPIHDFCIQTVDEGEDITERVLADKGYTFLLVSPHLDSADDSNFGSIDLIYEYAQEQQVPFYCLTASTGNAIQRWKDITGAEYPFCNTDETTLKTIIRSNPGLLLLKDGKVMRKWSHNALPDTGKLTEPLSRLEIGRQPDNSVLTGILGICGWYILPLLLLTLADRTWAWTKWLRNERNSNRILRILKKKKK